MAIFQLEYPSYSGFVRRTAPVLLPPEGWEVKADATYAASSHVPGVVQWPDIPPRPAAKNEAHGGIWYDNLHVYPTEFVRDLLLGEEVVPVSVWNGWRDRSVTLTQVASTGTNGTTMDIAAPAELGPTQEVTGTLTVHESGPAQQDGIFGFTFGDGTIVNVRVALTRAVPLPYEHNWAVDLGFSLAFETAVRANKSMHEQRLSLTSKPVREVQMSILATKLKAARLKAMLATANNRTFAVPLPQEPFQVVAVDDSGTVLTADRDLSGHWNLLRYCRAVLALRGDGTGFLRTLDTVDPAAGTVTLGSALPEEPWSALSFFPAIFGLVSRMTATYVTDELTRFSLTFSELAGAVQPPLSGVPALPAQLPLDPDWSESPSLALALARNLVGYPGTAQESHAVVERDPKSTTYSVSCSSGPALASLLDVFCAARGRAARFRFREPSAWAYTAREHVAGETSLTIHNTGWKPDTAGAQLTCLGASGLHALDVSGGVESTDGSTITFTLASGLPDPLPQGAGLFPNLLGRFDIDTLGLTFTSTRASSTSIRLKELVQEYEV